MKMNGRVVGSSNPKILWEQIAPELLEEWMSGWQATDAAGHIAAAALALGGQQLEPAEAALAAARAAGEQHPLLPMVTRQVERLRLGAAEVAAQDAWEPLFVAKVGSMSEASALAYRQQLDSYEAHQESKFFATIASEWDRRHSQAFARTSEGVLSDLLINWTFDELMASPRSVKDHSGNGHTWNFETGVAVDPVLGAGGGTAWAFKPGTGQSAWLSPGGHLPKFGSFDSRRTGIYVVFLGENLS